MQYNSLTHRKKILPHLMDFRNGGDLLNFGESQAKNSLSSGYDAMLEMYKCMLIKKMIILE